MISDLEGIARVAESAGVPLIVDNTLATPYLIRPFEWGAHIVVHSATKFLGGHGNSLAGLIVEAGTFDWAKSGKYKTMTEENPSYHGIRFYETFGDFAFCVAARALSLARSRAVPRADERVPGAHRHGDAALAHAAPLRQRAHRRASGSKPTAASSG